MKQLTVPAIAIRQGSKRVLYTFAIDGNQLHGIAQVSRLGRNDGGKIIGYQRPEVASHIDEIRAYLKSENPMLPNAIVLAFDSRVTFEAQGGRSTSSSPTVGFLCIPVSVDDGVDKVGWIVDGQQRAAAIRDASLVNFPIFVTAFITDSIDEQREQFILVNATKPLPKGLIYELLPTTDSHLPSHLQRKRFPSLLAQQLNFDPASPLRHKIQTPTTPEGVIKDNSILRMLENSLNDGALFRFHDSTRTPDIEEMMKLLINFWHAVAIVFSTAWELPPARSRLTHGAGIITMGHLMDAIADRLRNEGNPSREQFIADLSPLAPYCSWTDGYWNFGPGMQRKWNEIQNTSKDIQLVANYLLVQYKRLVWNAAPHEISAS
jgi:DGQHR domain-containing protein